MSKSVVTFLFVCGVFAGAAGQASAQGATWADRGYINVGWGVESGTSDMADSKTATVYEETATFNTASTFTSGSLFDVGAGIRVWKNLTVGVAYHQEQNDTEAAITGSVPSPVFFNRPRTLTASEPLDRKEAATHVTLGWVLALNDKFDVHVTAGPSFFRLTQDVISNVRQSETGATATTVGAEFEKDEAKKSVTGFNVGLDATYIFWSNDSVRLGAGGFFRFTNAETDLQMLSTSQPTKVGGTQFGLGARLRF